MISTVKLYKDCLIIDGRNFVVEDISSYLSTLTDTITFSKYQYVKHGLSISIKVNKSQSYLDYKASNDYNYCSIQNSNEDGTSPEKIIYYYVDKMNWTSENTIKLDLIMDTTNTFRATTDFVISDRTTINREHRDRWKKYDYDGEPRVYTTSTYCMIPDEDNPGLYISIVDIDTEADSLTVTSVTSNASLTSYTISDSVVTVTVKHNNPLTRINITVNAIVGYPDLYQRIIDPVSEGIHSILFKKSVEDISDNNNLAWYLVYKNNATLGVDDYNNLNPIKCELRASEAIQVKEYDSITINDSDLNDNDYIIITGYFNDLEPVPYYKADGTFESISVTGYSGATLKSRVDVMTQLTSTSTIAKNALIYKQSGTMYLALTNYVDGGSGFIDSAGIYGTVTVTKVVIKANMPVSSIDIYKSNSASFDAYVLYEPFANTTKNLTLSSPAVIESIKTLDRTDSRLIRVITCPYCPSGLQVKNQYYILGKGWQIGTDDGVSVVELVDLNMNMVNNIDTNIENPIKELYCKILNPQPTDARNDDNESKLFHSDYYQNKITYDSFNYLIALENLNATDETFQKTVPDLFKIDWVTANTINSRFLAIFPQLEYSKAVQDFEKVLYINRNNELPIFNSTFLNYLRNGYNYDIKQKDAAQEKANNDLALSIISAVSQIGTGIALGGIMGNLPGAIAGGITGTVAAVGSIAQQRVNAAYNIARQEDSIMQKLVEAKATATSVSIADDVNLLQQYCPVAKSINYEVGDNFKKAMANLFYYCGYKRDIQGIPNMDSRYWFNFVSADLVLKSTNNIPGDIILDIIARFKEGVTILHHHTTWNFDQDKENWEVSIL